jgi:hypothetical protein
MKHLLQTAGALLALCLSGALNANAAPLPDELAKPKAPAEESHARGGLPNFFARLKAGQETRIAYFGGSITAQEGWRPKTLKWFQGQYPQAKISQINAAIGGTGSDLGVFRLQRDVLDQQPHLVLVEFAVNDGGSSPEQIYRCMEGIVRQIWRANPECDIAFVYTLAGGMLAELQGGFYPRAASAMEKLAEHYQIPTIHMGLEVARLEKAGQLIFKGDQPKTDAEKQALAGKILFSPDSVHPYPETGHQVYLEAVVRGMEKIRVSGQPGPHRLGQPLVADNWEAARMVPLAKAEFSPGWQKLDPATNKVAKSFANRLPQLWLASQPGQSVTFKFKGTSAAIYDLVGPDGGQVQVTVDDQKPVKRARFDSYCTYHRLAKTELASNLPNGVHTVKVELLAEPLDKAKILSQRNEKIDRPERFAPLNWYAGEILVVGELVNP